ncbi:putative polyol transporter 3 [Turnera subulata]|uniref:Polyol transporter 3 n=1 Tax=Turnera subulata TaxID=218843 RepID=A0A9Q0G273_9ROSI|nr:putative polyol transporter 3 [Turnera subulata]
MIYIKDELNIHDTKVEVLVGILNICALVGSLLAGRTSDYIGRRYTIVVSCIIFMLGSILMGYGPNYGVLMAGRCTAGIGVGFALMIAPVYSAEVSSPSSRGFLTSLPELGISIGILLGYISNVVFGKLTLKLGWRLMLGVAAIPSLFLIFAILKMPESPRWLVMQGRLGEAKRILLKVSNSKEEAEARLRDIKIAAGIDEFCTDEIVKLDPETKSHGEGVWRELLVRPTKAVRYILIAAIGIHFFEHAVGIEAVVLYSPRIFKKAGVTNREKLLLATVGVGLTKFTFVLISTFLVDRVGRRRLLLVSTSGIVVALASLATCLTIVEHHQGQKLLWALSLSIVSTYIFVAFFNIGLAPITWVYSSEIFPLRLRAQGYSLGVAMNRLMNATISMTFLTLYEAITIGGAFFLFAGISVVALLFFYFLFPETKGRSLEDMEELFSKGIRARHQGVEIQARSKV